LWNACTDFKQARSERDNIQWHNRLLANDEAEFLRLAAQVWKESYSRTFRRNCRQRALEFDVNNIAKEWTVLLNDIHD
jgi:hypothetical protein